MSILKKMTDRYSDTKNEILSIDEYLELCKADKYAYAGPAERMLKAIGEPVITDTSKDPRLGRIFMNRTIKVYPAFAEFYGMENTIEQIVSYFQHSAQGLEESKQLLYLLGPVGGGKSSLAEKLTKIIEKEPFYTIAFDGNISPVFESPFGLFNALKMEQDISEEYDIPSTVFSRNIPSPWLLKRISESSGDFDRFTVVKMYPNKLTQVAVSKTEPGDDNNADISTLVGKVDIRKLEHFSQDDPDSYSFSGALNRGNRGVVELIEIWKAPIKTLHPLLTATQEGNYVGTEGISAIPFSGIILAHSNESEWQSFKNNKTNEAFIDRIYVVKVPYCLRITDEANIYRKMLEGSALSSAPCVPDTLEMLAQLSVLTRLKEHPNSNLYSKMRVYDGENIKDQDPKAKSLQEYHDSAGVDEGMNGISTRFAFKILSKTFNFDNTEIAADPVHLMYVLEESIKREQFGDQTEEKYINFIKDILMPRYAEKFGKILQKAYISSYASYGQNVFDQYISWADAWIQDIDYKDPDTGNLFDRNILNKELEKIEKPAGIANPKDFRNEVVNFVLRAKARNGGKSVDWTSYEKLREVIERKIFTQTEDILPVISFTSKANEEDQKKHDEFVARMKEEGYTEKQTQRLVDWWIRVRKSQ